MILKLLLEFWDVLPVTISNTFVLDHNRYNPPVYYQGYV